MTMDRGTVATEDWPLVRLGEMGHLLCGQSPRAREVNNTGTGVPYVSGPDQWDGASLRQDKWTTAPKRIAPEGSVFVTVKGAGVGTVFPGVEAAIGRDVYAFVPNETVDARFVEHALRFTTAEIVRQARGDIPGLSKSHLVNHTLRLPPLDEQRQIVAEIEKQLTRLGAGVAALKGVQANLKRYRAAVLKAACEGRLVPTEAALARQEGRSYEPASVLLERIKAEKAKTRVAAASRRGKQRRDGAATLPEDPPELPEGWAWARWDDIGYSQNGRAFPSREYADEGTKLLRPGNLRASGRVDWADGNTRRLPSQRAEENRDLLVGPRELVINLTAQSLADEFLGRVCLTGPEERCLLNQRLARLTPVLVLREYCLWMFKSRVFRRFVDGLSKGSLIQHMFTSQLAGFHVPLPPLAEQHRIVAEVERRFSVGDALEEAVKKGQGRADSLRQAILQAAFSAPCRKDATCANQ